VSAPLVVNTTDGTCWTRREATRDGEALYALADCKRCPELVMATYAELAEHGIAGEAWALPLPSGPAPVTTRQKVDEAFGIQARILKSALDQVFSVLAEGHFLRSAEAAADTDALIGSLWARVAELEAVVAAELARHTQYEDSPHCQLDGEYWPCRTVSALGAAEADGITRRIAPPQALRKDACTACGSVPEEWCPDCAACRNGCHGGHDGNPCSHPNARWAKAGQRAVLEDPHDGPLSHRYELGRDLPETGGAQ